MLLLRCLLLVTMAGGLWGATLEQLSLDDLAVRSTAIVQAQVRGSRSVRKGPFIYTLVQLDVVDQWKGKTIPQVEVALPGGQVGPLNQQFSGVPLMRAGQEIVAFLWAGPSGRVQLLGLTQGLFNVLRNGTGSALARRGVIDDLVLAPGTQTPVESPAIEMPLDDLAAKVREILASKGLSRP